MRCLSQSERAIDGAERRPPSKRLEKPSCKKHKGSTQGGGHGQLSQVKQVISMAESRGLACRTARGKHAQPQSNPLERGKGLKSEWGYALQ